MISIGQPVIVSHRKPTIISIGQPVIKIISHGNVCTIGLLCVLNIYIYIYDWNQKPSDPRIQESKESMYDVYMARS